MTVDVEPVEYAQIEALRALYRDEARCQIVHDSILRRGLGDSYRIQVDGRVGGYGGVWNKYSVGQLMEFYVLPRFRERAGDLYRELLRASGATRAEAQTNMPLMLTLLYDHAQEIAAENILFRDATVTRLPCPDGAEFRHAAPGADGPDPDAEWVLEVEGAIVASGGFLCHYNPPYGDVYMAVKEEARGRGYGSYLVQELKRVAYEAGKRPSARCNPDNLASRRTLEKAGFAVCGRLLSGAVKQA